MPSIHYSAVDQNGSMVYGYDNSSTNKKSLEKLKSEGLREIKFYGDALNSEERVDLKGLSKQAVMAQAKHDVSLILQPSLLNHFVFVFTRLQNILRLMVGVSIFLLGLYIDNIWVLGLGGALFSMVFVYDTLVVIGGISFIENFNKLYEAISYGKWQKAKEILDQFYYDWKRDMDDEAKVHFDTVAALLLAVEYPPDIALQKVEERYGFLKQNLPHKYTLLLAEIHYINGDYDEHIKAWEKLYLEYGEHTIMVLNFAVAHALYGDSLKAKKLLEEVEVEALPVMSIPLVDFTKALLLQEDALEESLVYFQNAIAALIAYKEMADMLRVISMVASYYALALYRYGDDEYAEELLETYWGVIKVHGDRYVLETLEKK